MQKKLLTLAVAGALAVPAVAFAQVTVYGTIDGSIRNQSKVKVGATDDSRLEVNGGLRTTNRWGLRGSEDLGGGLMANFTLEGSYGLETSGDSLDGFDRKAVVGLSKGGNSVDVGRDYTVNFKSQGIYDPMGYTYTGITPSAGTNTAGTRSNNLITAGFRFGTGGIRVDYALGEVVGPGASNDRIGFNADFAFGPVTVTGAFSTQETAVNVDTTTTNIGAAYKMGAFTFRGGWSDTEVDGAAGGNTPLLLLGVQYEISPTMGIRGGYYDLKAENAAGAEVGSSKTMIVGLDYSLSKRTTAYVVFDRRTLKGTLLTASTLADGATGIGAGVVHAF